MNKKQIDRARKDYEEKSLIYKKAQKQLSENGIDSQNGFIDQTIMDKAGKAFKDRELAKKKYNMLLSD